MEGRPAESGAAHALAVVKKKELRAKIEPIEQKRGRHHHQPSRVPVPKLVHGLTQQPVQQLMWQLLAKQQLAKQQLAQQPAQQWEQQPAQQQLARQPAHQTLQQAAQQAAVQQAAQLPLLQSELAGNTRLALALEAQVERIEKKRGQQQHQPSRVPVPKPVHGPAQLLPVWQLVRQPVRQPVRQLAVQRPVQQLAQQPL